MTRPMRHIRREVPPWQPTPTVTECGRDIVDSMRVIGRGEWRAIARDLAEERAVWARAGVKAVPKRKAPDVCLTCVETCARHPRWDLDPLAVLWRMFEMAGPLRDLDGVRARAELKALADLAVGDAVRFAELVDRHERDYRDRARPARRRPDPDQVAVVAAIRKVL